MKDGGYKKSEGEPGGSRVQSLASTKGIPCWLSPGCCSRPLPGSPLPLGLTATSDFVAEPGEDDKVGSRKGSVVGKLT